VRGWSPAGLCDASNAILSPRFFIPDIIQGLPIGGYQRKNELNPMRVYRVSYRSGKKHEGYDFFDKAIVANAAVTRAKARKLEGKIECYEVPTNREGKES
jgi:hypothetical protein